MQLGERIVVICNSGSGKTTLARKLAERIDALAIDLDPIHWEGQVLTQRNEDEAKAMVAARTAEPRWIIEGVYGWLAAVALPRATALLARSAMECVSRRPRSARAVERRDRRGARGFSHMGRSLFDTHHADLVCGT